MFSTLPTLNPASVSIAAAFEIAVLWRFSSSSNTLNALCISSVSLGSDNNGVSIRADGSDEASKASNLARYAA